MTNLKKIGLTALAGTLAATTFANAGSMSVSGTCYYGIPNYTS